jgi:hypothetical protein
VIIMSSNVSAVASEFILIPRETYKQLQKQPPEEPAVTIERQAVLASNRIPEEIKPKIIAAIDRNVINEVDTIEAANETSTTEIVDPSTAMETTTRDSEDTTNQMARERIFKTLDLRLTSPARRTRARQLFNVVVASSRVSLEPHTLHFVVDGSKLNTIDAVSFLSDLQIYNRRLTQAQIQLVLIARIPEEALINIDAQKAVQGTQQHISTSTPRTRPIVRGAALQRLRPHYTDTIISPIRPPAREPSAAPPEEEEEEEEDGIGPLDDRDFDQVFRNQETPTRRRPIEPDHNERLDGHLQNIGYNYTFD